MANWKRINEGWLIHLDMYQQIYIEQFPSSYGKKPPKWGVFGSCDEKEFKFDDFDTEAEAQAFMSKLTEDL